MKKSKLLIAPILVVPFLASCGGGSEEYKVSIPDTNGVSIYPGQAFKGKDYSGTIEIATDMIDKQILPDKLDKVTSGNKELQPKDYTYTLKEDKLTADFKIPAANIVGDVAIQLTLKDKPVDPYQVSEEEFNDACSFKDVQYVQSNLVSKDDKYTYTCPIELSPTVYHMINESTFPSYHEIFVRKNNDGSYEKATRDDKEKGYIFEAATEADFVTTQDASFNVLKQLKHVGLSYGSFTYDSKTGTYSATFTPEGNKSTVTTTLKFENKKLASDVSVESESGIQSTTFAYETKAPEYPEKTS